MYENFEQPSSIVGDGLRDDTTSMRMHSDVIIYSGDHKPAIVRKIICRYGRGCTHMHDLSHRERFWHPVVPQLTSMFKEFLSIVFPMLISLKSHFFMLLEIIYCTQLNNYVRTLSVTNAE